MTPTNTEGVVTDVAAIARGLSFLEIDLLTDRPSGWGSWMWSVSHDLCGKGLMRKVSDTEIRLTPLGIAVRIYLTSKGVTAS